MLAKEILNGISTRMTKAEMLDEISKAVKDLEFLDAHQIGKELGVSHHTIRAHANRNGIGVKMETDGKRVYAPSDVEIFREMVSHGGFRPSTAKMVEEMSKFREGGETLLSIAKIFGVTESYVSQLLRKARGNQ